MPYDVFLKVEAVEGERSSAGVQSLMLDGSVRLTDTQQTDSGWGTWEVNPTLVLNADADSAESPEHTMDNQLGYEFLVFKLPDNQAIGGIDLLGTSHDLPSDFFLI